MELNFVKIRILIPRLIHRLGVLIAPAQFTNDVQYLTNKPHVLLVCRYIELSLVVENPQWKLSVMTH